MNVSNPRTWLPVAMLLASVIASPSGSAAVAKPFLPMPALENDLYAFIEYATELAEQYKHDAEAFRLLAMPYGPLDISGASGLSDGKLRELRNMFFGAAAAAFRANPAVVSDRFFCERKCWSTRRIHVEERLQSLRKLAEKLGSFPGLETVASLGSNAYRFNDTVVIDDNHVAVALPSKGVGVIPSGESRKEPAGKLPELLRAAGASPADLKDLVAGLRDASMIALRREKDGRIRVVGNGFADNEWGVILGGTGSDSLPLEGTFLSGGKALAGGAKLGDRAWFYVTGAKVEGLEL